MRRPEIQAAATAAALLLVSLLIVLWARTRPGYDPYGWLVWGKLTLHWKLDTNGAPSWKPMPYLFTLPYSLAGHYALWLWMVTAVSVSLAGGLFAGRIAYRLTAQSGGPRYAAWGAALFAAGALFGIRDYTHFILSSQSDTMIVTTCLAAIDCQLSGRPRWALWMWVLGSLGRPEVWPFLGLFSLWAWLKEPGMRRQIVAGIASLPVLWFGIPALTAKTWFVAGHNAFNSPRAIKGGKIYGTIDRFLDLHLLAVWLAALAAVVWAAIRRERVALFLAAGTVLWVVVEIAFALHGWPAVPRYLFQAVGVVAILCGVFVGRVLTELPRLFAARNMAWVGSAAAAVIVVALLLAVEPGAHQRYTIERHDLTHERARTAEFNKLRTVVNTLGASRMLNCAKINIPIEYQSVLAWYLDIKIGILYVNPSTLARHDSPFLNVYPSGNGWKVFASNIPAADQARCSGLSRVFRG